MPDRLSGMEPHIGGGGSDAPSEQDLQDAEQCFAQALDYIDRMRYADACSALQDALTLVPGYPQATGLLALTTEIRHASESGLPVQENVEALRAYIRTLRIGHRSMPQPAAPSPLAERGVTLPWSSDEVQPPQVEEYSRPRWQPPRDAPAPSPEPVEWDRMLRTLSPLNPLDYVRLLSWYLLSPAKLRPYALAGRMERVMPVAMWLAASMLWLPLGIPALGLVIGTLPAAESALALAPVLLGVLLAWALSGWMMLHNAAPVALLLSSALGVMLVTFVMGSAGVLAGVLIGMLFLIVAGIAGGIAGVEATKAAANLAVGSAYVIVVAAVLRTFIWIAPVVTDYVRGFILGDVGGPVLIGLAVLMAGLMAAGLSSVIPYIGSYIVSFIVEAIVESGVESGGTQILGMLVLGMLATAYLLIAWISFFGGWQHLGSLMGG